MKDFRNSTVFNGIWNLWILANQILVGFGAKSKSNSFNLFEQRIWISSSSNPNTLPNSWHSNRPLVYLAKICANQFSLSLDMWKTHSSDLGA